MSHFLTKLVVIGAGTAAAGGGIVVGTSSKTTSSKQETFDSLTKKTIDTKPETSSTSSQKASICNVYLAESPTPKKAGESRKFTKFTDKFWSKDGFLKEVDKRKLWNKEELRREIADGCSKHGRVFVWWGVGNPASKGETWIYSKEMNTEKDWLKELKVDLSQLKQQDLPS
ncbi:hypothetical protein MHC_03050 [Mycoplasma haemocanis str. Illinois]|uniref:Uncharacterized protein n=1 Tax=Mycoplasma haemocanis (strain Illinois) TaxID=1111676 RepID=H6N748_MYCHN|nr:hypothetical protein [Mycoplasma haemocanis]AEW45470.1 hypothetical protein MHC_03050 [Mycoplasma haemocanis str. Illinois]